MQNYFDQGSVGFDTFLRQVLCKIDPRKDLELTGSLTLAVKQYSMGTEVMYRFFH